MIKILEDSEYLLIKLYSDEEREILSQIENELKKPPAEYELDVLWEYDLKIGGIGAYSMPANPIHNPFPCGIARTIFRPLQYARAQMDIEDINKRPRYIIHDVGLHFEGLAKYILKRKSKLGSVRNRKATLGKALHYLHKTEVIEDDLFESCKRIIDIYNISKHEVNQDLNKNRTFSPMDAIIFYLTIRKIGNILLEPYLEELFQEIGTDLNRISISRENMYC